MLGRKSILTVMIVTMGFWTMAQQVQLRSSQVASTDIQVDIYPNPAIDFLTVDLSDANTRSVTFELRSMIGNRILIRPEYIGYNKYRISLKDYATGYYFLIVRDERIRFKKAFKFLKR